MKICVIGASGRLGSLITDYIINKTSYRLHSIIVSNKSLKLNESYHGLKYKSSIENIEEIDVIIDASTRESTITHLQSAINYKKPYVIGTTGFNEKELDIIHHASTEIPIVIAQNFSQGIAILTQALKLITSHLGMEFDIEILEAHHRNKIDAPSGTAMHLFNSIKSVKTDIYPVTTDRFDNKSRKPNEVGIQSIRGGNIFGEHEVRFISDNEEIYIGHRVFNRKIFAEGAVKAAEWLIGKSAGLYDFQEVIELSKS